MKRLYFSLFLAFLGFLDATYLSILHFKHIIPPCTINGTNCEAVLTSSYASIGPIPLALVGSLYFLTLIITLGLFLQTKKPLLLTFLKLLVSSALIISGILVYIQAGVLHAFCQYCLGVEAINTLLFFMVIFIKKK